MLAREPKGDEELKWIDKCVRRLIRREKDGKNKIYIFGVSMYTRKIIQVLRKYKIEPVNVLDNDVRKQNSHCARVKVIAVEQVEHISDDEKVYIVCSAYWREMTAQLENKKVKRKKIYLFWRQKKTLLNHLFEAGQGRVIYNGLIRKYGDVPVFLCPYTGTGDIYLIGCFWKQYIERNGIENYIFVVINGACKKAAMLFGIKNIELLKKRSYCSNLLDYYLLYPDKVDMVVLNDSWPHIHTNPIEWFRGYHGLDFTKMFRKYVFHLPDDVKPEHPVFETAEEELTLLFEKYQLMPGKTVVLSPYSNTLADMADRFWADLAESLKEAGFAVCTNSSGEDEPAISGTVPVFFPLNIAPQFIEKAGYFVGIRSGFCDVISAANAKKVILYDAEERFYNGSSFEYFSLERMGLCDDASEIQFEREDTSLADTVLSKFI